MFGVDDMATGLVGAAGGLLNNYFAGQRQEQSEQFNAQQAQQQMQFQEHMSSTAYQRSMADMRAAGLNPILAYQKGGASSPSGAMASTSTAPVSDVIGPAMSSAMQHQRMRYELDKMTADTQKDIDTSDNLQAQTEEAKQRRIMIGAQTANINADTLDKSETLKRLAAEGVKAKTDEEFYASPFGKTMRYLGNVGGEAGRVFTGSTAKSSDQYGNVRSGYSIGVR